LLRINDESFPIPNSQLIQRFNAKGIFVAGVVYVGADRVIGYLLGRVGTQQWLDFARMLGSRIEPKVVVLG
jgi:hypothetical protein